MNSKEVSGKIADTLHIINKIFHSLESVCNRIHHLLEYMGSTFKDIVFIVNP